MLKLKIPPPVIGLVTAAAMWLTHNFLPEWSMTNSFLKSMAMILVLIGLLIEMLSVFRFYRAKTTINPLKPERSQKLVIKGLYRYSRNPMYLGMLTILLGFALWLGNPIALLMLTFFVWYISTFQIKPEEAVLLELFQDEYKTYQQRVRRWI